MEIKQYTYEQQMHQMIKQWKSKRYLETTQNKIKYTKIYKTEQAVLRGKFIEINVYINKKEKSNTQP